MRQIKRHRVRAAGCGLGFSLGLLAPAAAGATSAATPRLGLPVACQVGQTCFVQHYVDRDPSPGSRDFRCGTLTYDGHNGTDFRVPTLADQRRGVDVLAVSDGRVLRVRDGIADVRLESQAAVEGTECGNGVVLAHDGGLETQYCHLAQGSVAVRPGDAVRAGQPIGRIGLSGLTEFPHLHLVVRRNGAVLDPFAPDAGGTCGAGAPLWDDAAARALTYTAGAVLNAGFAPGPVTMEAIEAGEAGGGVNASAPALVAFVRAIGLNAGDVQRLTLLAPDGAVLARNDAPALERNRAQHMIFGGIRRPAAGWRPGTYRARYVVERGGATALQHEFSLDLKP